jgi:hypothetical protein
MDVFEIVVVHQLEVLARVSDPEVEGAPRDQCRLVRQAGETEKRFRVEVRHVGLLIGWEEC